MRKIEVRFDPKKHCASSDSPSTIVQSFPGQNQSLKNHWQPLDRLPKDSQALPKPCHRLPLSPIAAISATGSALVLIFFKFNTFTIARPAFEMTFASHSTEVAALRLATTWSTAERRITRANDAFFFAHQNATFAHMVLPK